MDLMMIGYNLKNIILQTLKLRVIRGFELLVSILFVPVCSFASLEDSIKYEVDEAQLLKPSLISRSDNDRAVLPQLFGEAGHELVDLFSIQSFVDR